MKTEKAWLRAKVTLRRLKKNWQSCKLDFNYPSSFSWCSETNLDHNMWFILKGHYSLSTCYSLASVPISLINCQFGGCAVDAALGNITSRLAARIIASVPRPETTVLIGSRGYHSFPAPLPFVFVLTSWEQKYIEELSWLKPDGLDLWSFFLLGYKLVPKSSHILLSLTWDGFNFAEIIFCCSLNPIGSLLLACCCLWVLRRGSPSQ